MSFEDDIEQIETVVGKMEAGDVNLDESIKFYKDGAALVKKCQTYLKETELSIKSLN